MKKGEIEEKERDPLGWRGRHAKQAHGLTM